MNAEISTHTFLTMIIEESCLFHVVWTNFFLAIILMWYTQNIFLFFFINWTLRMSDISPKEFKYWKISNSKKNDDMNIFRICYLKWTSWHGTIYLFSYKFSSWLRNRHSYRGQRWVILPSNSFIYDKIITIYYNISKVFKHS
jgi:hypothetical protein